LFRCSPSAAGDRLHGHQPAIRESRRYGKQVRVIRGDVSQFDDVMAAMANAKPERVINLAYWLGSEHPPRVAFKLNILGMDNA
jgi:hypothetical protein